MAKRLVVGNWKMNPVTLDEAKRIMRKTRRTAAELSRTDVVACPPSVFMSAGMSKAKAPHFHLGAQSASFEEGGPHTGEVSAAMLRDIGAEYVIVGHSETRKQKTGVQQDGQAETKLDGEGSIESGDTNAAVAKRVKAVLDAGLTPIVCVGEKSRDESGSHFDFLKEQIRGSFEGIPKSRSRDVVLAYEPVWAIGAKEAMKPEDIRETGIFVRKIFADIFGNDSGLKATVLYGGSVNFRNAADIITIGQVDGLLVGRESVNIAGFVELLKAVDAI